MLARGSLRTRIRTPTWHALTSPSIIIIFFGTLQQCNMDGSDNGDEELTDGSTLLTD